MRYRYAEPKRAHASGIVDLILYCLEHASHPDVVAGDDVAQFVDVVTASALPLHGAQIQAVMNPEVGERAEPVLVDRIPQPQFGSDAVIEPLQDRQTIAAFWSGREPEQFDWLDVPEQRLVGGCSRVVELVDDHHVEVIGRQIFCRLCVSEFSGRRAGPASEK